MLTQSQLLGLKLAQSQSQKMLDKLTEEQLKDLTDLCLEMAFRWIDDTVSNRWIDLLDDMPESKEMVIGVILISAISKLAEERSAKELEDDFNNSDFAGFDIGTDHSELGDYGAN